MALDYFSIKEEDTAWIIPVLVRVSNDLRIVATMVTTKIYKYSLFYCIYLPIILSIINRRMKKQAISTINSYVNP